MKVLLDENFPLGLVRVLRADGLEVDHIITLAWRGASDARIRQRLTDGEVIFLTQDEDFLSGEAVAATIVVSRVRQVRTLASGFRCGGPRCRGSSRWNGPRGCSSSPMMAPSYPGRRRHRVADGCGDVPVSAPVRSP